MNMEFFKPMIYNLCDSLETDVTFNGHRIQGKACREIPLFEGYSPQVSSEITDSLLDPYGIAAVCVRIWGNLAVLIVNERKTDRLTLFVYNRAKVRPGSKPWVDCWSRRKVYDFLGPCCKAIYHRSVFDTEWQVLDQGPQKLSTYNEMREACEGSKDSYLAMWGAL